MGMAHIKWIHFCAYVCLPLLHTTPCRDDDVQDKYVVNIMFVLHKDIKFFPKDFFFFLVCNLWCFFWRETASEWAAKVGICVKKGNKIMCSYSKVHFVYYYFREWTIYRTWWWWWWRWRQRCALESRLEKFYLKIMFQCFATFLLLYRKHYQQHLEIYVNLKMRSGGELFVINKSLQFACDCNTQQRHWWVCCWMFSFSV